MRPYYKIISRVKDANEAYIVIECLKNMSGTSIKEAIRHAQDARDRPVL